MKLRLVAKAVLHFKSHPDRYRDKTEIAMPQSRKRQGHHPYKKTSNIPSSQRTSGHLTWAILFAIFAVLICFFAFGNNWILLLVGAVIGGAIGYYIGRNMEKSA